MGAEARIMVIGPSRILRDHGVLDYPDDWYGFEKNKIVTGTACNVWTTGTSHALAELCCVDRCDVDNHIVKDVDLVNCDYDELERCSVTRDQIQTLAELVRHPDVTVWFLPNT